MPDLSVQLGSLTLRNPVLVAAGTAGYGVEFQQSLPLERLGALVTKTLTRRPRTGSAPPRLVETPAGLLNAVGLQNVGMDAFLTEKLPALKTSQVPVIVSILGESEEDVRIMIRQLDGAAGVAAIELNLSCPNIARQSALMIAQDADATATIVQAACAMTRKPVIAKLSPEVTDLAPIAQAAERAGASALSLINTFVGMSLDPKTRRSRLGAVTGGLSGPAIRPLAVHRVWYTAQHVSIPIIGLGGIVRADDAVEFFLAGATAVAVGTANFADPAAALRILKGLERYLIRERIPSIAALREAVQWP